MREKEWLVWEMQDACEGNPLVKKQNLVLRSKRRGVRFNEGLEKE